MSGDGMGGMALAILVSMVLILLLAFGVFYAIGRFVATRKGWTGRKRNLTGIGAGFAGILLGLIAVSATFFESTFSPPPQITFAAPPGFDHEWVILLEDQRVSTSLQWSGVNAPFTSQSTRINIPSSGVLRVQSLDQIAGRGDLDIRWTDGSQNNGMASGGAPEATGASLYVAYNRMPAGATGPNIAGEPPFGDNDAMAAYIAARENPPPNIP